MGGAVGGGKAAEVTPRAEARTTNVESPAAMSGFLLGGFRPLTAPQGFVFNLRQVLVTPRSPPFTPIHPRCGSGGLAGGMLGRRIGASWSHWPCDAFNKHTHDHGLHVLKSWFDMAESNNKSTATTAAAGGVSPTPAAGAAGPVLNGGVAGGLSQSIDWEDHLDAIGVTGAGEAPNQEELQSDGAAELLSGEEDEGKGQRTQEVRGQRSDVKGQGEGEGAADEEEEEEEQEQETETDTSAESATATAGKLGQFELGVLKTLRDNKIPESLQKRIAKSFEKEIRNRDALSQRDGIISTKDTELAELRSKLETAATQATQAPSGPLAHLDSIEKVENARAEVHQYLQAARNPDWVAHYFPDDGENVRNPQSGLQKFEAWKEQQIEVLAALPYQAKIVTERAEARKKLLTALPTVAKPEHEDAKALQGFFASDPRTRTDADEVFRLYLRAKKIEENEAKGIRYHAIDPNASSKKSVNGQGSTVNGNGSNGHAHANGDHASPESNGRKSSLTLPAPRTAARVPVRSQGSTPLEAVNKQLEAGQPVDAESWAEAQAASN